MFDFFQPICVSHVPLPHLASNNSNDFQRSVNAATTHHSFFPFKKLGQCINVQCEGAIIRALAMP